MLRFLELCEIFFLGFLMHLRHLAASVPYSRSSISAAVLAVLLASCGGGSGSGGGGSAPSVTPTSAPTLRVVDSGTIDWKAPYGDQLPLLLILGYATLAGDDTFSIDIYNSSSITPVTSSEEIVRYSLSLGNGSPLPPAAGSPFAYFQFQVEPASITLPSGAHFGIAGAVDVLAFDPLGIPAGTYVGCTVYAGTQLIGSGSNISLSLQGYYCNAANHGNSSTIFPYFPLPSIQAGTIYTVVFSRLG